MDVPRVTEILKYYNSYGAVAKDVLLRAAERGTRVHSICAGISKDNWIPDSMIEEECLGFVNSFKKWVQNDVKEFIVTEQRYYDGYLGFTGQVDYVVLGYDNERYLIDIKTTSRPHKLYPLQMAAYEYLLRRNAMRVKGTKLVYLNRNGEYPCVHYLEDMSEELSVFMGALDVWKYLNKRKEKNGRDETRKEKPEFATKDSSDNGRDKVHSEGGKDS